MRKETKMKNEKFLFLFLIFFIIFNVSCSKQNNEKEREEILAKYEKYGIVEKDFNKLEVRIGGNYKRLHIFYTHGGNEEYMEHFKTLNERWAIF